MPRRRDGIYFNRKTKEIVSTNGHVDGLDLKGWVKISDNPRLRLLVVRELLLEKGLIRNERAVYWSGFRASGRADDVGQTLGLTLSKRTERESELRSSQRRDSGSAARRLLRSIFGPRRAF